MTIYTVETDPTVYFFCFGGRKMAFLFVIYIE